jgi:hypothetical protein
MDGVIILKEHPAMLRFDENYLIRFNTDRLSWPCRGPAGGGVFMLSISAKAITRPRR